MPSSPDLPLELQNEILSHCEWQEKLALRLVSRSWFESTTDALFNEHTLFCFARSLEKLKAISRSRLMKRVKILTVYSMTLRGNQAGQPVLELDEFKGKMSWRTDLACICPPSRVLDDCVQPMHLLQAYARYLDYAESQRAFMEDLETLRQIVGNLNLHSLVIRHFEDDLDTETTSLGSSTLWNAHSLALVKALTTRGRGEAKNHEIAPVLLQGVRSLRKLSIQQQCSRPWDVVLPEIMELDLEITAGVDDANAAVRQTMLSLLQCRNLKRLKIVNQCTAYQGGTFAQHAYLDEVFFAEWPCLVDVTLTVMASSKALLAFLPGKRVKLIECQVDDVQTLLEGLPGLDVEITQLFEWRSVEPEWPYFENGLDEATREWMRGGPKPVWELKQPSWIVDCGRCIEDPCVC